MRRVLIPAFIILICVGAWAQDAKPDKPDGRLDQKVTLEISHTKLEDICKYLTEKTGVTIKAGSGERDWKVRERKVTIQAKDVPLGRLLKETAGLLGFMLTPSGKEGEWTYTFWQDMKARLLAEEMISAEREARAARIKKLREASLDAAEKALKMTPEQAAKERESRPWLAFLGGTKSGRAAASLLSYINQHCPTDRELMMRGLESNLTIADLPPEIQQAVTDTLKAGLAQMYPVESEGIVPFQITIEMPDEDEASFIGAKLDFYGRSTSPDEFGEYESRHMGMLPIIDADSAAGKFIGKLAMDLEEGVSPDQAMQKAQSEVEPGFIADVLGYESSTEKDPPTDPDLTREIEIKKIPGMDKDFDLEGDPLTIGKMTAEIARATGWTVVYESFSKPNNLIKMIAPGKQPLYKILIGLEKIGYTWKKGEGTLRIRPSDWALRRSYEIPESFVADCMALVNKQGVLTIDDHAWIASSLTDDQIIKTLWDERPLSSIISSQMFDKQGTECRQMLRLYGSLTWQQKSAMATEAGLPFGQLTQSQWDQVNASVSQRMAGIQIADGLLTMSTDKEKIDRVYLGGQLWLQGVTEPEPFGTMVYMNDKQRIDEILKEYERIRNATSNGKE